MARVFGMSISRSTVLRLVEALPDPDVPAPRAVGVDEYATREGRHYGTVLVDVESRRPVDLLPDREASSLAAWLAKRSGIEVVRRDRAPFFAEGATAGAPQVVQVVDRWHLWHNLRGHRFADRTRANHAPVHELLAVGLSRRAIGRQLRMTSRTVKLLADAATPRRTCSRGIGRAGRPNSTPSSPTWMNAGTKAVRAPGGCGRRSCRSAIRAATRGFAPISGRSASRLAAPSRLGHRHPGSSPDASTATTMQSSPASPCPGAPMSSKATSTGSRCPNARCFGRVGFGLLRKRVLLAERLRSLCAKIANRKHRG
ncbi:ISL3 family transposase [Streptomyces sp. NBC_01439]|uniref:ISL3 family transposase n=1 Tax=Streptomyces sp. NBC_01439 TaxID=2903867 RepID=UPI003FCDD009